MMTDAIVQDQKKRTLEAIERRFAHAEAELHLQKQKNIKRSHQENKRLALVDSSLAEMTDAVPTPSPNISSKKGSFAFSGYSSAQDVEVNGPTYFQLSHSVHENLLTTSLKVPDRRGNIVSHVLHELLQRGDSARKYLQGSKSLKIDNCILLDNLVQGRRGSVGVPIRALKSQSKRSKKHLSIKQHKNCGTFDLPPELHNFDMFKPMHDMWKDYIMQLLRNVGKNQLAQCLLTADLHGANILVVQCKIAAFTGVSGIMIRETVETFGIITQDNKFRVVPKKNSVFIFQADCWKITLLGDQLTSRTMGLR